MKNILIADDEVDIVKILTTFLTAKGFAVTTAKNGKEAEVIINTKKIDLLITDLIMPEQEGIETIRKIKKKNKSLKVIAMSGGYNGSDGLLESAKLLGANDIIEKPFLLDKIHEKILNVLDS